MSDGPAPKAGPIAYSALTVGPREAMGPRLICFGAAVVCAAVRGLVAVPVETLPRRTSRRRESHWRSEREH